MRGMVSTTVLELPPSAWVVVVIVRAHTCT
jgi:hypothetical protein